MSLIGESLEKHGFFICLVVVLFAFRFFSTFFIDISLLFDSKSKLYFSTVFHATEYSFQNNSMLNYTKGKLANGVIKKLQIRNRCSEK